MASIVLVFASVAIFVLVLVFVVLVLEKIISTDRCQFIFISPTTGIIR